MSIKRSLVLLAAAMVLSVGAASATITQDLADFTEIIGNSTSGLTGMLVNMMGIFMDPPLVYFVTIGIFVTIIGIVAGLIMRRGRRGRR